MKIKKSKAKKQRYAAKLLFQFRVMVDDKPGKMRLCEERIINCMATHARDALRIAKSAGKEAQHNYKNSDGNKVFFEFIGVMELISCDDVLNKNEVWYDIKTYRQPLERRNKLIPSESKLSAIRVEG